MPRCFRLDDRMERNSVAHGIPTIDSGSINQSTTPDPISLESYEKLRSLAARYLRSERADHTLQATALVHEAFMRVLTQGDLSWKSQRHVIAFAARAMRRILISYAVARSRLKRGGPGLVRLSLDEAIDFCDEQNLNIVAVGEALDELERLDTRQAQIVEMRFFGGLSVTEIASTLHVSNATVKREWATAKLWLRGYLSLFSGGS